MSNTRKKWNVKDKFSIGFEMEMFTLDRKGNIVHEGDTIISETKRNFKEVYVTKEAGKHMFEIGSNPASDMRKSFGDLTHNLSRVWEIAQKKKLLLYPFATYPGEFHPIINSSIWYDLQETLWGKDKFTINGLCSGFHFHFSIPQKVFAKKQKVLEPKSNRKEQDSFISCYNFLIAADPVTTTFMQSSPFIQGRYLAKDSRMLFYRGGENLNYNGLWHDFQIFGGLQSYAQTVTDIAKLIEKRYDIFKSQLIHWGFDPKLISKYARRLDVAWNPVKVNKHGTYEQRGMDMNLPSYALGVSLLLKYSLKRIINEKIDVVPSDLGIYRPFKLEGNKLYIPPISVVQQELQYLSATEGLSNGKIHRYCKSLYNFAFNDSNGDAKKMAKRLSEMLTEKKTVSDNLIEEIKKAGVDPVDGYINKKTAAKLAEKWSYDFLDDIEYTQKLLE